MSDRLPTKVIQHMLTNERFMYPQDLPTPRNFFLSNNQTQVPLVYPVQWEAEGIDPLKIGEDPS